MPKVPFVPSSWESVNTMVELSGVKPGQKVADLGSGDGRLLIAFARRGAEVHGYEIDSDLITRAENNVLNEALGDNVFIHFGDYWREDLSPYDVVTIYGLSSIMDRLEAKLGAELKPGAKVVSNVFVFPNLKPDKREDSIYLYTIPSR